MAPKKNHTTQNKKTYKVLLAPKATVDAYVGPITRSQSKALAVQAVQQTIEDVSMTKATKSKYVISLERLKTDKSLVAARHSAKSSDSSTGGKASLSLSDVLSQSDSTPVKSKKWNYLAELPPVQMVYPEPEERFLVPGPGLF